MTDRFRTAPNDNYDAIVVGAGVGGLVTAALLARHGRKVLIVDAHSVAGGNTTMFTRRGYEFDVGLHYIGGCHDDGMIPRILRASGARGVTFEELDPDGYDTLVFPDFTFRMPKGRDAFRTRLLEHFPDERDGIERYLKLVNAVALMQKAGAGGHALATAARHSWPLLRWGNGTFGAFLDSCTRDPQLKAVLAGQHGDYAQPPSRASCVVGAGLTLHYLEGAYVPRGGGQALSDSLADSIEANGGKVSLLTIAHKILVRDGRAVGVEIESKHFGRRVVRAPVVVSNADLKQTMRDLVGAPAISGSTLRRVDDYAMSPALGVLYLGIRRDLRAEGHAKTNYWINPTYDYETGYAQVARGELIDPPFVYVSLSSVKDPTHPRLAPAGVTNLQLMSLAPSSPAAWGVTEEDVASGSYRKNAKYKAKKEAFAQSLLHGAARVFPDIASQVVFEEVATPLTHRRYTRASEGTSYGIALTPEQFLWKRPNAETEVAGLYLCGASCRAGHGIAGAMMSGVMAVGAIDGSSVYRDVFGPRNVASGLVTAPSTTEAAE